MKRKFAALDPMKSHLSTVMSRFGLLTSLHTGVGWRGWRGEGMLAVFLINQAQANTGSRRVTHRVSCYHLYARQLPFVGD